VFVASPAARQPLSVRCILRGQYGYVYEGFHLKTNTPVAIKRVDRTRSKPEYISLEIAVLRVSNECPDIVDLLDVFETDNYVYMVMEMFVHPAASRQVTLLVHASKRAHV